MRSRPGVNADLTITGAKSSDRRKGSPRRVSRANRE